MKYLLDTHIWLWIHREPERLCPALGELLRNPANELWLSPISVWEALLLHKKGRLILHSNPHSWARMMSVQLREAAFTHEVAVVSTELELLHPDPADRFLAATALVHDLTLVTADAKLLGVAGIRTLGNV